MGLQDPNESLRSNDFMGNSHYRKAFKETNSENAELQKELEKLKLDLVLARKKLDTLLGKSQNQKASLNVSFQIKKMDQKMIAFQKSKIATYEVAIQSIQKHSDSLQTRLTSTEKYCKHLDEERHKDLEKIEELKQQINELKQQISILLQENKALKNVVEELQMENDSSQNELEKYRPKYYETLRQLGEVRDKLRLKEAQKENLQTKIELYLKEKESSDTAMWFLHELNAEGGLPSAKDPKVIVNFTQKITQNNKEQGGVFEWLANFFVSCFFKR